MSRDKIDNIINDEIKTLNGWFEAFKGDKSIEDNLKLQISIARAKLHHMADGDEAEKLLKEGVIQKEFYETFYLGFLEKMISDLSKLGKYEGGVFETVKSGVFSFFGSDPVEELMEMQISPSSSFEENVNSFVPLLERIKDKISFSIENGAVAIKVKGSKQPFEVILQLIGSKYMEISPQNISTEENLATGMNYMENIFPQEREALTREGLIRKDLIKEDLAIDEVDETDETDEFDETDIVFSGTIDIAREPIDIDIDIVLRGEINRLSEWIETFKSDERIVHNFNTQIEKAKEKLQKIQGEGGDEAEELLKEGVIQKEFCKTFYLGFLEQMIGDLSRSGKYEEGVGETVKGGVSSFPGSDPTAELMEISASSSFEVNSFVSLVKRIKDKISVGIEKNGAVAINVEGSGHPFEAILLKIIVNYRKISAQGVENTLPKSMEVMPTEDIATVTSTENKEDKKEVGENLARETEPLVKNQVDQGSAGKKEKVKERKVRRRVVPLAVIEPPDSEKNLNVVKTDATEINDLGQQNQGENVTNIDITNPTEQLISKQEAVTTEQEKKDQDTQIPANDKVELNPQGKAVVSDEQLTGQIVEERGERRIKQEAHTRVVQEQIGVLKDTVNTMRDSIHKIMWDLQNPELNEYVPDIKVENRDDPLTYHLNDAEFGALNVTLADERYCILYAIDTKLYKLHEKLNIPNEEEKLTPENVISSHLTVMNQIKTDLITNRQLRALTTANESVGTVLFRALLDCFRSVGELLKESLKSKHQYKPQFLASDAESRLAEVMEKAHADINKSVAEIQKSLDEQASTDDEQASTDDGESEGTRPC